MPTTVAAFDWDGTLTRRDCVVPFMAMVAGRARFAGRLASAPLPLVGAAVRRDRDRLKQLGVMAAFQHRRVDDVADLGRRYAEHVHQQWMRPDTLARLRWHQAAGHAVVIVSASLAPYLEPLGRRLGVDAVLCTRLAVEAERYTGALEGPNCRGAHKVERLRSWCADRTDLGQVGWAYGDSRGDAALLDTAVHPVWVGRQPVEAVPPLVDDAS